MNSLESNKVVMNMWLFRMFRMYQLFHPGNKRIFGLNVYQLGIVSVMSIAQFLTICASLGHLTHRDKAIDEIIKFQLMYFYTMNTLCLLKSITLVFRADDIWGLFDVTCVDFLTSEGCQKHVGILHNYFNVTVKITNLLTVLSIGTFSLWIIFPLIQLFFTEKSMSAVASFNQNVINLQFPVSVSVYNNNYFSFYIIELVIGTALELTTIIFDIFFVLFCYAIIAQYEIVAQAYEDIGYEQNSQNDCDAHYTDDHYDKFKSILFDQQKLYTKLKLFYSIIWTIILPSVAVNSTAIIVLTYSFVVIFLSAESLPLFSVFKLASPILYAIFELFFLCYLMEYINIKKESVKLGMYSCNWPAMDLKTRKLLLLAMRIEDANKLMIKSTPKKIINLQLFNSVMVTSYNIVSVMLKTRSK